MRTRHGPTFLDDSTRFVPTTLPALLRIGIAVLEPCGAAVPGTVNTMGNGVSVTGGLPLPSSRPRTGSPLSSASARSGCEPAPPCGAQLLSAQPALGNPPSGDLAVRRNRFRGPRGPVRS